MFCSYLVSINHSWGKSKALRKMVHHFFFVQNWQYFRAFQTSKRDWKSFHMIILKKVKFKWSTLGRCSQDEIFPFAIIRILKEKTKRLQNDSGNKSNRRWSTPSLVKKKLTTIYLLLSSLRSPLLHNQSWEFSYLFCPSQTLVSLSGNNWPVGWHF